MRIFDLLTVDRIRILETRDKNEALNQISDLLANAESIKDPEELKKAIFDRENIISTSIGLGIAIPHVRLASVSEMTIAVGIAKQGIEYQSFDDQPVNIIIMIAAPEGAHREYLSVLAKIALLLKNRSLRDSILDADSPEEIYEVLKGH